MVKRKIQKNKRKTNELKKEIVITALETLLLLMVAFGIGTFIFSNNLNHREKIDNITTSYLTFSYKENEDDHIQLKSSTPLNDKKAKENFTNYFEFEITNSSDVKNKYQIVLQPNSKLLDEKYLKIYLTNTKNKPMRGFEKEVPVWSDLEKEGENVIIYTDELDKKENKAFRLMVWLSDDYIATDEAHDFSFKVVIKDNNK